MASVSDENEMRLRISAALTNTKLLGLKQTTKIPGTSQRLGRAHWQVCRATRKLPCLTSVVRERSAPAVSRTRTQSSLPASQARKRGV